MDLTKPQLADSTCYQSGCMIQFHQNCPGFQRGQRLTVVSVNDGKVYAQQPNGNIQLLALEWAGRFQVYKSASIRLAKGDLIRVTQNGFTQDGKHRLNNGAVYQIHSFTKEGDLRLRNGWVVPSTYGNFTYGYCHTSHAAQGRTVDHVFIAQSTESLGASSLEQFYVSSSRARKTIHIYTDDKESLKHAITRSNKRISGQDLIKTKPSPKQSLYALALQLHRHVMWREMTENVVLGRQL